MDMVERVARAMWAQRMAVCEKAGMAILSWDDENEFLHGNVMDEARAAIEAMREPTEAMNDAGNRIGDYPWDGKRPSCVFVAMIDAALSPPPPSSTSVE